MRTILAVTLTMLMTTFPAFAEEVGKIAVSGEGHVALAPDMATISLGVTSQALTSKEALAANSETVRKVLAEVRDAGVADRDIQTSGLTLSPVWTEYIGPEAGPREIIGFSVRNLVSIRIRALDTVGTILDVVVGNGANQFHGLTFGIQNPTPFEDEARQLAIKDAMRKAEQMAETAGISLGALLQFGENSRPRVQPAMARGLELSDAVPIASGELSISATVTMVYEIAE